MNEAHDETIEALLRRQFEGPVADNGFSERLMQQLPPRHPRTVWPLWLGMLMGGTACGICLAFVPLLRHGCRAWLAGEPSTSAIGMCLVMAAMSLLALGWGLMENRNR